MSEATFTTQRGVIQTTRPYSEISDAEAKEILLDNIHFGGKYCQEQYNISKQTLHHLKFHRAERVLEGVNIHAPRGVDGAKILELKQQGLNSLEVASKLNIPLEKVNKVWAVLE